MSWRTGQCEEQRLRNTQTASFLIRRCPFLSAQAGLTVGEVALEVGTVRRRQWRSEAVQQGFAGGQELDATLGWAPLERKASERDQALDDPLLVADLTLQTEALRQEPSRFERIASAPGGLSQLVQRRRDARAATHALPHGQTLAVKCLRVDKMAGEASQIAESVQ